jgi:hypothetical protein
MAFLKRKHPALRRLYNVLLEKKFDKTFINKVYQEGDVIYANIHLPENKERSDLEKIMPNLQQELGATAISLGKTSGKYIEIKFGMRELKKIDFTPELLHDGTLKVEFPSAFGKHILDFEDGSSCHLLNGGTTRMGKTCFLLYIATCIYLQNKGKVKFYISSAKLKDYYPFDGIPDIKMSMTHAELESHLEEIQNEYKIRNNWLYSPSLRKATDAKSVRKLYPEMYHKFRPIFLFIDEYARFAENQNIQKMVTEIVETAGFVNIHVIIASQRPDASTVLKPRIRANLLARMAFTTVDKKNSEIILDREGAEQLGKIAGRGILLDSDAHTIQVPFLDAVYCDELLQPYQQIQEEKQDEQIEEGRIDTAVANKIQGMLSESDSLLDLSLELEPSQCSEQSTEKNVIVWSGFPDTKRTGQMLPIHAESDSNPSQNGENRPLLENS